MSQQMKCVSCRDGACHQCTGIFTVARDDHNPQAGNQPMLCCCKHDHTPPPSRRVRPR